MDVKRLWRWPNTQKRKEKNNFHSFLTLSKSSNAQRLSAANKRKTRSGGPTPMRARAERIFYFARQRAETDENDALNLREIVQNVQNLEF